ncbi:MAG: hypothetical protein V1702_01085 [Candidatus Woesearchaeota archaeon]
MLNQFSQAELEMFKKDFMGIIHICRKLNDNVWRVEQGIRYNIEILNRHIERFSGKYKTLQVKLDTTPYYEVKPVVLLRDEKDFYNVFSIAGRITGEIESVTMFIEGRYKVVVPEVFEKDFDKFKPYMKRGNIYFNLFSANKIPRRLHLRYSEKHDMIELIFDSLDFTTADPEFRLCAYYGLSFGYGPEELEDIDNLFIGPVSSTDQQFKGSLGGGGSSL